MNPLPDRLNLDHLKKQAKQLIRLYRSRDPAAMARFRSTLPATSGLSDGTFVPRTAPARCAIMHRARTRFASWPDLKRLLSAGGAQKERAVRVLHWAQLVIPATSAAWSTAPIRAWLADSGR